MKKIILTSLLAISFGINQSSAQDVHFSHFSQSPLTLNPALAGANYEMQGLINYRNQWKQVAEPFKTTAASFDMRLNSNKRNKTGHLAAGINFFNDQAGEAKVVSNNVNLNLAYHVLINDENTIGGGLYTGFGQRYIAPESGQWASQYDGMAYDPSLNSGETFLTDRFSIADVGAGVVYTYKKSEGYMTKNDNLWINVGAAGYHLNRPKYSFLNAPEERLYVRISTFANAIIGINNTRISLMPAIYYQRQGTAQEILMGNYFRFLIKESSNYTGYYKAAAASVGVFYRNKDAAIIKGMLEWGDYAFGVAYDFNVSTLSEASTGRGGIEFFLRYGMLGGKSAGRARI
jgi:type IX secretion system PorP/SprF family membrane protein